MQPQDSLPALLEKLRSFREKRDWRQFHTPKNLAMSISIEAAELMEHFQWLTPDESETYIHQDTGRQEVAEELADILMYCFHLADIMGLDVEKTVLDKMEKNEKRFPVDRVYGKFK